MRRRMRRRMRRFNRRNACVDACVHWYFDRVGFAKKNFFLGTIKFFKLLNFSRQLWYLPKYRPCLVVKLLNFSRQIVEFLALRDLVYTPRYRRKHHSANLIDLLVL